jgi:hypothetical protein
VKAFTNGFIEPCIPTRAAKPPAGPDWVHGIKHRLIVGRDGDTVRLFTLRGYDWSDRCSGGKCASSLLTTVLARTRRIASRVALTSRPKERGAHIRVEPSRDCRLRSPSTIRRPSLRRGQRS